MLKRFTYLKFYNAGVKFSQDIVKRLLNKPISQSRKAWGVGLVQIGVRRKPTATSEANPANECGQKQTEIIIPYVANYQQTKARWALLTLNLNKSINFNFNGKVIENENIIHLFFFFFANCTIFLNHKN